MGRAVVGVWRCVRHGVKIIPGEVYTEFTDEQLKYMTAGFGCVKYTDKEPKSTKEPDHVCIQPQDVESEPGVESV